MDNADKKNISRRGFLKMAAVGAAGLSLVGCSASTPPAPASGKDGSSAAAPTAAKQAGSAPASSGPVKLTFWSWQNHDKDLAAAFMEKNPNIQIETTIGGPWDLQDKLVAALAAGTGAPDVARIVMRMFDKFSGPGKGMWDITDRAAAFKNDAPEWAWSLLTKGGKIYGLPSENNLCGLFYRKDVFDKNGLKAPKSWDEFIDHGKQIRQKENAAMLPLWIPGGQWASDHYRMYLQNRGGNIFSADGKLIEKNQMAKDTLRWYYDLKAKQGIAYPTQIFQPEFYAAMNANSFVTWPMNSGDIVSMKKNCAGLSGKWARAPLPLWSESGPKYNAELGSSGISIPEQGKHKEEAWAFAQFYALTTQGQLLLWQKGNQIPAYRPVLESKEVSDNPDPYFGGGTLRDFLADRTTPVFNYIGWADVSVIIGEEIDNMWADKQSPEQAWDNIEKRIKGKGIGV